MYNELNLIADVLKRIRNVPVDNGLASVDLTVEVIWSAMRSLIDGSSKTIPEAFAYGMEEWII